MNKYDREMEDIAQAEWCREWAKQTREKEIRKIQHWHNFKIFLKYAWYEFKAAIKGR